MLNEAKKQYIYNVLNISSESIQERFRKDMHFLL